MKLMNWCRKWIDEGDEGDGGDGDNGDLMRLHEEDQWRSMEIEEFHADREFDADHDYWIDEIAKRSMKLMNWCR